MCTRRSWLPLVFITLLVFATSAARAELTSLSGSAAVVVQEYRSGQPGDTDQASDSYPTTSSTLPLQVVARLLAGGETGAASVAAQFADPRDLDQPNPEEFAINLALLSAAENIRYSAQATTQETRGVIFRAGDFVGFQDGETVLLVGRLYIDGALAVFSPTAGQDLTGASVYLRVTVVQQVEGGAEQTVFTGRVGLEGGPSASVTQVAEGSFPTGTLIRSDLAVYMEEFDVFETLIIPSLLISYTYDATIGQPFTLRATVEVEAANAEGDVGVAGVVGAPVDMIQEVISAAQGELSAAKAINALQQERANPTGESAFPAATRSPLLPLCGLLGFEFVLGLGALVGLRLCRPVCRRMLTK